MDYLDKYSQLLAQLRTMCKPSRYMHSCSVAGVMKHLCIRYGADADAGVLAGLLHDSCKDMNLEKQWEYALKFEGIKKFEKVISIVESMKSHPDYSGKVIHGPAAAMRALELGITDNIAIIEAIALHSTGMPGMELLSKLLFIADKLEPLRPYRNSSDEEAMHMMGLDELLLYALKQSMSWILHENGTIAEKTIDLYNALTE